MAEPRVPDLNAPAPEEDPFEIERALDQLELAKIQKQKASFSLAEQISPIIDEEKERLRKRFWYRDLGELPSANEMIEVIINRFASEDARNANKPNVPRAHLRYLKSWLTRAEK